MVGVILFAVYITADRYTSELLLLPYHTQCLGLGTKPKGVKNRP